MVQFGVEKYLALHDSKNTYINTGGLQLAITGIYGILTVKGEYNPHL